MKCIVTVSFQCLIQYCWSSFHFILLYIHNIWSCNIIMDWRMKIAVLSDAIVDRYQCFIWTRCLHLRSRRAGRAVKNCSRFYSEDARIRFLRNDRPTYQTTRRHTDTFRQVATFLSCIREVRWYLSLDALSPDWGFRSFSHYLLKCIDVPETKPRPLPCICFQFCYSVSIMPCDAILSVILTASLIEPWRRN
jgi:hypothetical protein